MVWYDWVDGWVGVGEVASLRFSHCRSAASRRLTSQQFGAPERPLQRLEAWRLVVEVGRAVVGEERVREVVRMMVAVNCMVEGWRGGWVIGMMGLEY